MRSPSYLIVELASSLSALWFKASKTDILRTSAPSRFVSYGLCPTASLLYRSLNSGQNWAIGPVGVLTIAATYLILGRTLDQTRNIIREESVEKKERFDSRRIPFLFVFTG